jgi:hypothetical protein
MGKFPPAAIHAWRGDGGTGDGGFGKGFDQLNPNDDV